MHNMYYKIIYMIFNVFINTFMKIHNIVCSGGVFMKGYMRNHNCIVPRHIATLDKLYSGSIIGLSVMVAFVALVAICFMFNELSKNGLLPDDAKGINCYKQQLGILTVMMIAGAVIFVFFVILCIAFSILKFLCNKKSRSPNLNNPSSEFDNLSSQDFPLLQKNRQSMR